MHFASPKKALLFSSFAGTVHNSHRWMKNITRSLLSRSHAADGALAVQSPQTFFPFPPLPRPLKKDTKWVKSPSSSRGEKRRGDDRRNPPLFAPQRLFSSPSTRLPPPPPPLVLSPFVPSGRLIMCTLSPPPPPPFEGPRPLPLQSLFPGGKVMQQVGGESA